MRGEVMAIYAFDGTTCTPRNLSNVFRMYDAYESRHKFYATGPGSRGTWLSKGIESMTGHGGKDRIHDAFEVWNYWKNLKKSEKEKSRETIIIGFSRGAVIARELANKICDADGQVDFLGLFDSVGSFGNPFNMVDIGYRKSIPSGVVYCAQALSTHEERFTFRVIRANLAKGNTKTTVQECWFPGVHSDVGGTLKRGLGAASLNWMFEQASNVNPDQWNKEALGEAEKNVDCDEEPSENKVSLPVWFCKSLRTRKIRKGDSICCADNPKPEPGSPQPATPATSE